MGYDADDRMVRVDFFKDSGKWYTTEAVRWTGRYDKDSFIHEELALSLHDHLGFKETDEYVQKGVRKAGEHRLSGMSAVCLEPYHAHAYPLRLDVDEIPMYLERRHAREAKSPK